MTHGKAYNTLAYILTDHEAMGVLRFGMRKENQFKISFNQKAGFPSKGKLVNLIFRM